MVVLSCPCHGNPKQAWVTPTTTSYWSQIAGTGAQGACSARCGLALPRHSPINSSVESCYLMTRKGALYCSLLCPACFAGIKPEKDRKKGKETQQEKRERRGTGASNLPLCTLPLLCLPIIAMACRDCIRQCPLDLFTNICKPPSRAWGYQRLCCFPFIAVEFGLPVSCCSHGVLRRSGPVVLPSDCGHLINLRIHSPQADSDKADPR